MNRFRVFEDGIGFLGLQVPYQYFKGHISASQEDAVDLFWFLASYQVPNIPSAFMDDIRSAQKKIQWLLANGHEIRAHVTVYDYTNIGQYSLEDSEYHECINFEIEIMDPDVALLTKLMWS